MNLNDLTASRIKDIRLEKGITAKTVAKQLNLSESSYSQVENGHTDLTLPRIEALAKIFQVSISDFFPTINNGSHTYNGDNGVNVSNSSNHTINNFFADNNNISKVVEIIKDALTNQGK